MGLFRKENAAVSETVCPVCKMEFSAPERLLRHMVKAHRRKKIQCDSCGFRN